MFATQVTTPQNSRVWYKMLGCWHGASVAHRTILKKGHLTQFNTQLLTMHVSGQWWGVAYVWLHLKVTQWHVVIGSIMVWLTGADQSRALLIDRESVISARKVVWKCSILESPEQKLVANKPRYIVWFIKTRYCSWFKGSRPVLEGFVVTMLEDACKKEVQSRGR